MENGTIVRSAAGRDKDRFYVVVGKENDFVYIVDGKVHSLEKPKKKRLKHVRRTNEIVNVSELCTNRALRKLLTKYNGNVEDGEVITCQKKM